MTNSTVQHSNSVSTWNWNIAAAPYPHRDDDRPEQLGPASTWNWG